MLHNDHRRTQHGVPTYRATRRLAVLAWLAAALTAGLVAFIVSAYRAERRVSVPSTALASAEGRATAVPERSSLSADGIRAGEAANAQRVLPRRASVPPQVNDVAALAAPTAALDSELSGLVLDAIGGPIAGAWVSARAATGAELGVRATSEAGGEFRLRLPKGVWQLSVQADGYARTQREVFAPARGVRLLLAPESVISGHVVRSGDGQPVAGVTVTAKKSDPPYSLRSTVSDVAGAFELRQLPAGTHHLEALSSEFRAERVSAHVAAASNASQVELVGTSATSVRGEIRAGGSGCNTGILTLLGPVSLSASADEAGRVEVQGVLPGSYELSVACPSARPFSERLVAGNAPIRRVWELEAGNVIRGSVETAAGRPLPGASVTWTRRAEPQPEAAAPAPPALGSSCVSDVHGEFVCSGLSPGHYDGALHVRSTLHSAAPELHVQGAEDPARIRLRADASATIRISLDAAAHAPRPALAVFACSSTGQSLLAQYDGQVFLLEGLPLGSYGVHVGTSECSRGSEASVRLEHDGQIAEVSLPMPRLARVHGRLVDARGVPVPDAWVRVADTHLAWALLAESPSAVMTDVEGRFDLSGLLPGRYDLFAHGPFESGAARLQVELEAGDEREHELVLDDGAQGTSPLGRSTVNETK